MPDLLVELFSEEIPARFQKGAENNLKESFSELLENRKLFFETIGVFSTPRRLTLVVTGLPEHSLSYLEEKRGPRTNAGEKALAGFKKSNELVDENIFVRSEKKGEFYFAKVQKGNEPTSTVVSQELSKLIRNFPWPNSMRWGSKSIRWVRPLQSIICILYDNNDCQVVPLNLDGLEATNVCEGHRSASDNRFIVNSFDDYEKKLKDSKVLLDRNSRKTKIWNDAITLAFANGMEVVEDEGLLEEVTGLVEWPVIIWGDISPDFRVLPSEVLQVSMRQHQKFFSVKSKKTGEVVSFISVANILSEDNRTIISDGNKKVLTARLSDAKFFWENDCRNIQKNGFESLLESLREVTFHSEIGSEYERVLRLVEIGAKVGESIGANIEDVKIAGSLAKLDLVSEMVYEFPELQGVMGKHYAVLAGYPRHIANACSEHYSPRGLFDPIPDNLVSIALALADKIDLITNFWAIDKKPTGSKDPFAIRRAAIGIVRIIFEKKIDVALHDIILFGNKNADVDDLLDFFKERVRVQLKEQGITSDIVNSCISLSNKGLNLLELHAKSIAINSFIGSRSGKDLIQVYKRANNILVSQEQKEALSFSNEPDLSIIKEEVELQLYNKVTVTSVEIEAALKSNDFEGSLRKLAVLKPSLDAFFEKVQINVEDPKIRKNRLTILNCVRNLMHKIAKFSELEMDT